MKWVVVAGAVVAVLAFAALSIERGFIDTKQDTAAVAIRAEFTPAIQRFHQTVGRYPTSDEGLLSLVQQSASAGSRWQGPYLQPPKVPLDPWGRPFRYRAPGRRSRGAFDVWSAGPDGVDSDDDIGNWQD